MGTNGFTGTVCSRPTTPLAQPHWKTATTTPYAARASGTRRPVAPDCDGKRAASVSAAFCDSAPGMRKLSLNVLLRWLLTPMMATASVSRGGTRNLTRGLLEWRACCADEAHDRGW